jgi:hypothetical protein
MLGELRFKQKRYPEGAALLEQALQYDPNSIPALRGLVGTIYSIESSRRRLGSH